MNGHAFQVTRVRHLWPVGARQDHADRSAFAVVSRARADVNVVKQAITLSNSSHPARIARGFARRVRTRC